MSYSKKDEIHDLCQVVRESPDMVYIGDEYLLFYVPIIDKCLLCLGDYRELTEEEVNIVVIEQFTSYLARMN